MATPGRSVQLIGGRGFQLRLDGVDEVIANLNREVSKMEMRSKTAIEAALLIVDAKAVEYTPVDTGNLINSRYRKVFGSGNRHFGEIGYTAAYAIPVHEIQTEFQKPGARWKFLEVALHETAAEVLATIARITNVENQQAI